MRRGLPWILLLACASLGLLIFQQARREAPSETEVDRTAPPRREPSLRGAGAGRRGAPREGEATGASVEEDDAPQLPPFVVEGRTRFQRRLSVGTELLRVRRAVESERLPARAASQRLRELGSDPFLLLDQVTRLFDAGAHDTPDTATTLLRFLTDPRRDPEGLRLHGVEEAADALGTNLRVRAWTAGGALAASAVYGGDSLVARLDSHAGVVSEDGYDVLATPGMGNDVFPEREFPWPFVAAGYYTAEDDLCVVGTRHDPALVALVLKHELVHAWQHRHLPGMRSRFLQEGLAEYLSRMESNDYRLEVPLDRIRDELAALSRMLDRMERIGVSWRGVVPARLLALDPPAFYRLGHMGYLLGLATLAFVGPETIESALKMSSERVLESAVRGIDWADFLRFLREGGEGGDPAQARWIQDGRGGEARSTRRGGRYDGAATVLRGLGVSVPPAVRDRRLGQLLEQERPFPAQDAGRLDAALRAVIQGGGRVLFLADATTRMDAPLRAVEALGADGEPVVPGLLGVDTRQAFAELLLDAAKQGRAGDDVVTGCLTSAVGTCRWPVELVATELTLQRIPDWVRGQKGTGATVVVCLASLDMQRDAIREAIARALDTTPAQVEDETLGQVFAGLLADLLDERGVAPSTVLVVDLADGDSDALALAQAFAEYLGEGANVAYWNPQRTLRD